MTDETKRAPLRFYRSEGGAEPVRDWLMELPVTDRKKIGEGLKTLEYGWPIGMPLSKGLGQGLHELRVSLAHHRIARVMFCIHGEQLIALHGFIKKSRKTPRADLETARRRKKRIESST